MPNGLNSMRIFQEETFGPAVSVAKFYPAHAAFGGYKQSGIGRETHPMMLEHYQETKNLWSVMPSRPKGSSEGLRLRMRIAIGDQSRMELPEPDPPAAHAVWL